MPPTADVLKTPQNMSTIPNLSKCCFWCQNEKSKLCPDCQLVNVCQSHWSIHRRDVCFPIKVDSDPAFGRRLMAVRNIQRGEIIMIDSPSALGPTHSSLPLCLECSTLLPHPTFTCPYCGYPLCGQSCVGGLYMRRNVK